MDIAISDLLNKEIENISKEIPFLTKEAVLSISIRLGIDAWKKDPKILLDMLKIGNSADQSKSKPAKRRSRRPKAQIEAAKQDPAKEVAPKEKKSAVKKEAPVKVRSANAAGDSGFSGKPPKSPNIDEGGILGIPTSTSDDSEF
jgi:hypothetical protein